MTGISRTSSFKIQKFCVQPTVHLCVLRGSQNKLRLFLSTTLTYRFFIMEAQRVYYAVRTGSLKETDTVSSLKG